MDSLSDQLDVVIVGGYFGVGVSGGGGEWRREGGRASGRAVDGHEGWSVREILPPSSSVVLE